VSDKINREMGHGYAGYYHAKMEDDVRSEAQYNWQNNITRVIVATVAFGELLLRVAWSLGDHSSRGAVITLRVPLLPLLLLLLMMCRHGHQQAGEHMQASAS